MTVLKEFREFAVRGNVVDLAVGIIIGGAFGRIVDSLVNDIVMQGYFLLIGRKNRLYQPLYCPWQRTGWHTPHF